MILMMRWALRSILLLGLLWLAGLLWFWLTLPSQSQSLARTDGVVALTGGEGRLRAAMNLLENKRVRRVLITGVHRETGKRQLAATLGVSMALMRCCVDIEHEAGNTIGNAKAAAQWVAVEHIRSLRLVTSDYHMPRALLEFQAMLPNVEIVPTPVPGQIGISGLLLEYAKYSVRLITVRFEGHEGHAESERQ